MTEATGQALVVLAVLQAVAGWRWVQPGQYAVLAAFTAFRAAEVQGWALVVVLVVVLGCGIAAWRRSPAERRAGPRVRLGAVAAVVAAVPLLAALQPSAGLDVLAGAVPAAAAGLVVLCARRADGAAMTGRAALFASVAAGSGVAGLPLAAMLLAVEWRDVLVAAAAQRGPVLLAAGLGALVWVLGANTLPGVPQTAVVAGLAAAGAAVHLLAGRHRPGVLSAAGLALAVLGAGTDGMGPEGFAASVVLAGLSLHAAGLLFLAGGQPVPALLATCVVDVSAWTMRGVPAGVAIPVGLAAAGWAGILLLRPRPAGRWMPEVSVLHGGVTLCAVGLGTVPTLHAGSFHAAGFLLAQAGAVSRPWRRWVPVLIMAGLPPGALFVSEFLLLRAAGRVFWPLAAVLALAAFALCRRLPRRVTGMGTAEWGLLAASAVLGALAWATAP